MQFLLGALAGIVIASAIVAWLFHDRVQQAEPDSKLFLAAKANLGLLWSYALGLLALIAGVLLDGNELERIFNNHASLIYVLGLPVLKEVLRTFVNWHKEQK